MPDSEKPIDPVKEIVRTRIPSVLSQKVREETGLGNLRDHHLSYMLHYITGYFRAKSAITAVVMRDNRKVIFIQPRGEGNKPLSLKEFKSVCKDASPTLRQVEKALPAFFQLDYTIKIVRVLERHIKNLEQIS